MTLLGVPGQPLGAAGPGDVSFEPGANAANAGIAPMPGTQGHVGGTRAAQGAPVGTSAGGGGSGTGQKIMGRLEQALGAVLSSESMKARGLEKEKEAVAKQDMNEAQRLEALAANHRARADNNRGTGGAGGGGISGY